MLLAIDVGNTNTVIGLFAGEELRQHWRFSTRVESTGDEVGIALRELLAAFEISIEDIDSVVFSNVVPALNRSYIDMCDRYLRTAPLVVSQDIKMGIEIRTDNPSEVGADRIVNSVAAFQKYGGPAIVIDFGTATTYDAISRDGAYLGGAIAPGMRISTDALFTKAAKLQRVEIAPPLEGNVIGTNTVESMQAGIFYGFVGQIEGIVQKMKGELGGSAKVIATGGLASLVGEHTDAIDVVDDWLTLEGLRSIWELNSAG